MNFYRDLTIPKPERNFNEIHSLLMSKNKDKN